MVYTLENQQRVFWLLSNVLLKLYLCIILPILLLSADELKCGCELVCRLVCRLVCTHACMFGEGRHHRHRVARLCRVL